MLADFAEVGDGLGSDRDLCGEQLLSHSTA